MRRFLLSLTFCTFLLAAGAFVFSTASSAKEDLVSALLRVPAPPPPNPLVPQRTARPDFFFSKRKVPADDAPIRELTDYWRYQSNQHQNLRYMPKPSPRVMDRIRAEIAKKPESVADFLNIFNDSREGADFVKNIYDNWPDIDDDETGGKQKVNTWLAWNSPHHVRQLEKAAQKAGERGEYVTNFDQLVTLAKYDWESARPTVDRLYSDQSQPVSRVLATWALYSHSLEEKSLGDIDRYRDELKAFVEDKKASAGMRDLAFDAIVTEGEWNGRDEWYFSLLEDETLADLRVNGSSYTGLTTIILNSHPDKYADKMIELVKSTNPVVRSAAARNLAVIVDPERPDVVKALLPWLDDPKWATDTGESRMKVLNALQSVKVPESVPSLIKLLDEKETVYVNPNAYAANAANIMANAANAIANAADAPARDVFTVPRVYASSNTAVNSNRLPMNTANVGKPVITYPRRDEAIRALQMQEDMRAAPALRRILRETEGYMRGMVVKAILQCKGYTVAEQANAMETIARTSVEQMARMTAETGITEEDLQNDRTLFQRAATNSYVNSINDLINSPQGSEYMLGTELAQVREPGDQLIREVIVRMAQLEKREPDVARALRNFLIMWKGSAVNSLFLKDLKDGKADAQSVVKLLSIRKELQERHSGEVSDARRGGPVPNAIGACIAESQDAYPDILNGENLEAKAALLGCARLIRAQLPVKDVAKYLSSTDKRLAAAAESYLESEDSPEARNIVLSLHPNEAKIMGATSGFWPEKSLVTASLTDLFESVSSGNPSIGNRNAALGLLINSGTQEISDAKALREEIKKEADLIGLYSYEDNIVRIYKEKVEYTWGTDDSRYHERLLSKEEFDGFTGYLSSQHVDELAPFLDCEQYYCPSEQLLMLGKNGGRRVFVNGSSVPEFFQGLKREFETLRRGDVKLRYRLEKEVPGLEILLADEDQAAITVWKGGNNIRVLVADAVKRKQIDTEIEKAVEEFDEEEEASDEESEIYSGEQKAYDLEEKRRYENYEWFNFDTGRLGTKAEQPAEAAYVPVLDNFTVTADTDRWKSKTAAVEFRVDGEGLHKIVGGKISKYKTGDYSYPVVTPNGKWLFVSKYSDEGNELVRINLTTNREFPVKSDKFSIMRPIAYVASVNKILASPYMSEDYEDYQGSGVGLMWVDPDTGVIMPARGELRPLEDQDFRPLQAGPAANEFWAAVYDAKDNKTVVGVYSTRTFTLKPVLAIPKIRFDSMDMWVDQPTGKVYFVYNGHLLSLPLAAKK